jgi:hypothetical protein
MSTSKQVQATAPRAPRVRLALGVTGHRAGHIHFAANRERVVAAMRAVFDLIDGVLNAATPPFGTPFAPVRLHSMLADGFDQIAASEGLARNWELLAPLPFGRVLNRAINAIPNGADDARALLMGDHLPTDKGVADRANAISALYEQAHLFELADDDPEVTTAFLAMHDAPRDPTIADAFKADASLRVALAARLVIEQSDFLVAVWDGRRTSLVGGTGHTIAAALDRGAAVVWIDPAAPEAWRVLTVPEALASLERARPDEAERAGQISQLVRAAVLPDAAVLAEHGAVPNTARDALEVNQWHAHSNRWTLAYRRIETVFGEDPGGTRWRSLRRNYETPDEIASGSAAPTLAAMGALPGIDDRFIASVKTGILARFAWADAISSHLSDVYRSGMIVNFGLSACAIIGGVAYLPLTGGAMKWPFAMFEFVLLSAILFITFTGQKRRWHGRWFETRRIAEYLRHAPLLLALGAARPPGRWPRGAQTSWPEHYARHSLREVGLPRAVVTPDYLRHALTRLLDSHVSAQRDYHHAKARKLAAAHHNLDRLSVLMFQIAVAAVLVYLAIVAAASFGWVAAKALSTAGKTFTFLGVALPTLGGAIAGIRYFGDFERFAAISEITAARLDAVHDRIALLLQAPDDAMDYGPVADLAHAADDIVVSEIENWQAVFAGKHITVPV